MKYEHSTTVRGIAVTIHAEDFTEDLSVGMNWGPETVFATRDGTGEEFELTDEEREEWGVKAGEATYDGSLEIYD